MIVCESRDYSGLLRFSQYDSPLGKVVYAADADGLTNLWLEGQRGIPDAEDMAANAPGADVVGGNARGLSQGAFDFSSFGSVGAALACARAWLGDYFAGVQPAVDVPLHLVGTDFERSVWRILLTVPYGNTTTYGTIAAAIASERGVAHMSAQAIGGAVGHNKISLIVPCHRVVGADGNLTGYGGGLDKKIWLLKNERVNMARLFLPKSTGALTGTSASGNSGALKSMSEGAGLQ